MEQEARARSGPELIERHAGTVQARPDSYSSELEAALALKAAAHLTLETEFQWTLALTIRRAITRPSSTAARDERRRSWFPAAAYCLAVAPPSPCRAAGR